MKWLIGVLLASTLISGCAAPTTSPKQLMPQNLDVRAHPIVDVSLGNVSLGYAPQNAHEGEMLRSAFRQSLIRANIFSSSAANSLDIKLQTFAVDIPAFAAAFEVKTIGSYIVSTTRDRTVFETSVNTTGVSHAFEHFSGAERASIATRRAAAENIRIFIGRLSAYLKDNHDRVVALAHNSMSHERREKPKQKKSDRSSSGSSFFVDSLGHLITNAHVVENCKTVSIRIGGVDELATIVSSDETNDLALLKVGVKPKSFAIFQRDTRVRAGDPVVVFGFPFRGLLANSGSVTTGSVTALAGIGNDSRTMQITAPVQPGNSGGPAFDQYGRVIGIVKSKLNSLLVAKVTGDIPQNINFAIKAAAIGTFLATSDISPVKKNTTRKLEPADVGEIASLITFPLDCKL